MDKIEPRIHDEINDYTEKFYGLSLRQWLFVVLIGGINIPLYLYVTPVFGADISSWLVMIIALPLGFVGFIPVQELKAEKIIPYWYRHLMMFAKPLEYKTEKEITEEKEKRKNRKKVSKSKKPKVKKISRKEKKHSERLLRVQKRELKRERRKERELAEAKKKFSSVSNDFSPEEREKLRKLMEDKEVRSNE